MLYAIMQSNLILYCIESVNTFDLNLFLTFRQFLCFTALCIKRDRVLNNTFLLCGNNRLWLWFWLWFWLWVWFWVWVNFLSLIWIWFYRWLSLIWLFLSIRFNWCLFCIFFFKLIINFIFFQNCSSFSNTFSECC